ncbi:MAG TPA: hypothetical protein VE396_08265 [Xanthobacteraceae bacterium]|jgi:hypothetical protein|nr:hypothetical protein [Xanthobacteraceae bacterium]
MTATTTKPLLRTVTDKGGRVLGFVLRRFESFEAYTAREVSIGVFDTEPAAVAAVLEKAETQP